MAMIQVSVVSSVYCMPVHNTYVTMQGMQGQTWCMTELALSVACTGGKWQFVSIVIVTLVCRHVSIVPRLNVSAFCWLIAGGPGAFPM